MVVAMIKGDWIRSMTDDELAKFLNNMLLACLCKISTKTREHPCELCITSVYCRAGDVGFSDWLKEEYNEYGMETINTRVER